MKFKKGLSIILFLSCCLLTACSSGDKKTEKDKFENGKVILKIACKKDVTVSYSLYLPSGYTEEKKYPVIFAFDAHAKGNKPVELFRDMAEKYGYIVIGSNNSRNGMSTNENMGIYDMLSDDALTRFSIDRNRVYTAGFSGGSRVASSVAIFKGGICGVIGCSAGFPSLEQPIQFKFDYIGFVGDEDMNYLEMITLEDALQKAGYRHQLVVFHGKHDWPPKEVIPDAFIWLEANAMKDLKKPVDKEFIKQTIKTWQEEAAKLEKQNKIYDAYKIYLKIANYFEKLDDLTEVKKKINALSSSAVVRKETAQSEKNRQTEMSLQTRYLKALGEKNPAWWKEEIRQMNNIAEKSKNEDEQAITCRLLGYLSLTAYSYSNACLNAGKLDQAEHYIELYSIIDPTNSEHAYFSAVLNVKLGNTEKAFESLEKALSLGFNDFGRYQGDTVLARLKNDTRYFDILERLRQGNQ